MDVLLVSAVPAVGGLARFAAEGRADSGSGLLES
jgi:hypothetical protein